MQDIVINPAIEKKLELVSTRLITDGFMPILNSGKAKGLQKAAYDAMVILLDTFPSITLLSVVSALFPYIADRNSSSKNGRTAAARIAVNAVDVLSRIFSPTHTPTSSEEYSSDDSTCPTPSELKRDHEYVTPLKQNRSTLQKKVKLLLKSPQCTAAIVRNEKNVDAENKSYFERAIHELKEILRHGDNDTVSSPSLNKKENLLSDVAAIAPCSHLYVH